MSKHFTPKSDQQAALSAGGDIVLTASAGTGKTTVLVERFAATLLSEVKEVESTAPLKRMVGITFTDLAAAEMKQRLRRKLQESKETIGEELSNDLLKELDGAYIGTIHSFCMRLLRENFIEAELSPGFGILANEEAVELQEAAAAETVQEAIGSAFEFNNHKDSLLLTIALARGTSAIAESIISLSNNLRSDGFLEIEFDSLLAKYEQLWREAAQNTQTELSACLHNIVSCVNEFEQIGGKAKTVLALRDIAQNALASKANLIEDVDYLLSKAEYNDIKPDLKMRLPSSATKHSEAIRIEVLKLKLLIGDKLKPDQLDLLDKNEIPAIALDCLVGIKKDLPAIKLVISLVSDYLTRYQARKYSLDKLDFDDLMLLTVKLFQQHPQVLKTYHKQFRHIFVDEFQDVNDVQRSLILLLRNLESKERDLFLVGDSKQSIYRFRYADVREFNSFTEQIRHQGGNRLNLVSNFRSHKKLIKAFNAIFSQLLRASFDGLQTDYSPVESFAQIEGPDLPRTSIINLAAKGANYEGMVVSRAIEDLVNNDSTLLPGRKFGYSDIVLLFSARSKLPQYETELRRAGIPYSVIKGKGLYQQREIWDIAAYLKMIWFPEDNFSTTAVLRSPFCALSENTLFALAETGLLTDEELFRADIEQSAREIIDYQIPTDELERFKVLQMQVNAHREQLDLISSALMIEEVLDTSGYHAQLLSQDSGDQRGANVRKLIELAREYEGDGTSSSLEFSLDLWGRIYEDSNEQQATIIDASDRVCLMTVHQAKGLEFPVVILLDTANTGKQNTDWLSYDKEIGIGISAAKGDNAPLLKWIGKNQVKQDSAENIRKLYVAMTRSKEALIIPVLDQELLSKGNSWAGLLNGIDLDQLEQDGHIKLVEDSSFVQRPKADVNLAVEFDFDANVVNYKSVDPEIQSIVDRVYSPMSLHTATMQAGVWDIIHSIYPKTDDYKLMQHLQETAQEADGEDHFSQWAKLGTAVHRVLEAIDYCQPIDHQALSQLLDKYEFDEDMSSQAARDIHNWLKTDDASKLATATKLWREVPFLLKVEYDSTELLINGVIDLIAEFEDGSRWLIDYKYAKMKESAPYRLQMQIYSLLFVQLWGKAPDQISLVYLRESENLCQDIAIDEVQIRKLPQELISRLKYQITAKQSEQEQSRE